MKNEETITYTENGDNYKGIMPYKDALRLLRDNGYAMAYTGRKMRSTGLKVLVGINDHNQVFLEERRKNGLYKANVKSI